MNAQPPSNRPFWLFMAKLFAVMLAVLLAEHWFLH
jgi:hypothetical protein